MHRRVWAALFCLLPLSPLMAADEPRVLDGQLHHLRIAGPPEWSEFPEQPESDALEVRFEATANERELTLELEQQDVKQTWRVLLNEQLLGNLPQDENPMVVYFPVAPGLLKSSNVLRVEQHAGQDRKGDDVRIGRVRLYDDSMREVLSQSAVELTVTDATSGQPVPCRITVISGEGALQSTGLTSNDQLAVRPGVIYTRDGKARIELPAGRYQLYAGRGFEWSLDTTRLELTEGQTAQQTLTIRREVPTSGYVACDPHIHTLSYSGHGDATIEERVITLAGEGIELPISTDHNVHVDFEPVARKLKVRQYFTPVVGNEVTTRVGHFNIFPVVLSAAPPDAQLDRWEAIFRSIYRTPEVKAVILNHGRDLHSGVRPLGPKLHNHVVGENLEGWTLAANAMEVINSGATQTDPTQLLHDWMGLLNCGYRITPVGSSDSHDVARHFVGQGRTYIRCDDRDPAAISVKQAVDNFLQGQVMVSYGLLTEMTVNSRYESGEIAPLLEDPLHVKVRVLGPHWVRADRVELYANGHKIQEAVISGSEEGKEGVKWEGEWQLARPHHDLHLVAIATGPGIEGLYWKTAKPYQPMSPHWTARVLACSGAVWIDVDGDGRSTPARHYARQLADGSGGDLDKLLGALAPYDQAVAEQAAFLYQSRGGNLLSPDTQSSLRSSAPHVQAGFRSYLESWRENQIARGS